MTCGTCLTIDVNYFFRDSARGAASESHSSSSPPVRPLELVGTMLCRAALIALAVRSLVAGRHPCFSTQTDFLPNALAGNWSAVGPTQLASDEQAGRRRGYGDFSCQHEEELFMCGNRDGPTSLWTTLNRDAGARMRTAAYALGHTMLRPHACDLPDFHALKLDAALRGKKLRLVGDSTVRQMFSAMACSMPNATVERHEKHQLTLASGGIIQYADRPVKSDDDLVRLGHGAGGKSSVIDALFESCKENNTIQMHQLTLHHTNTSELARLLDSLHDDLRARFANSQPAPCWNIVFGPTLQHFRTPGAAGHTSMDVGAHSCTSGACAHAPALRENPRHARTALASAPADTDGAAHVEHESKSGCHPSVCLPPRELALGRIQELRLPLAILGSEFMTDIGLAHLQPALHFPQDCTHWCMPGVPDARAAMLAALVIEHDGSHARFLAAMEKSRAHANATAGVARAHATATAGLVRGRRRKSIR